MLLGAALHEFLTDDWGNRARFFEGAVPADNYAVAAGDLYRLACRDAIESRLISDDFELEFGPFDNTDAFTDGFLMVQCLEQQLEQVSKLIDEQFGFIPRWQIDDVMASLGGDGKNCGAHFDHYDVFLLQMAGDKTWFLDDGGHGDEDLDQNAELRLLRDFEATQSLQASPGDVLYIPPGVGHHGIARGQSLTLSVGVRNPTTTELMAEISEFVIENCDKLPLATAIQHPGSETDASAVSSQLPAILSDDIVETWYGCYMTRLRDPEVLAEQSRPKSVSGDYCATLPTRLAWTKLSGSIVLFANGQAFHCSNEDKNWISTLCDERRISIRQATTSQSVIVPELIGNGSLIQV